MSLYRYFAQRLSPSTWYRVRILNGFVGSSLCQNRTIRDTSVRDQENRHSSSNEIKNKLQEIFKLQHTNISNWIVENKVKQLCYEYGQENSDGQKLLLEHLATNYSVSYENVFHEAKLMLEAKQPHSYEKLKEQLTPAYRWLFVKVSRLEGGVKFLVDLRVRVSELMKQADTAKRSELKLLDNELHGLLLLWFSVGFLNLHRVTWSSPCDILERIAFYEVIHPLRNWTELKQRLGPFRRCYIFTHPSMPREPIVILHTALCNTIPATTLEIQISQRRIHGAVNENSITFADEQNDAITSAIFYSISSPHKGLQGIELGNYLIKEVARKIKAEFPCVNTLATLSPIPGIAAWLDNLLATRGTSLFDNNERLELQQIMQETDFAEKLRALFGKSLWSKNEELCSVLKLPFLQLCAWYLCEQKSGKYAQDKVANFHLRNGAMIYRINWMANNTVAGISRDIGMMVNYKYHLNDSEENSRQYLENYVIQISEDVEKLVRGGEERLRNAGHFK